MRNVSVIIVSWNACKFLQGCLDSLYAHGSNLLHEIIVVDNASTDGSPEMVASKFPGVVLVRSAENLGFARANNIGIRQATGTVLALINSDVVVHAGCIEVLVSFLTQHKDVGLVGPRITGGDGKLQFSCRRLPSIWNHVCCVFGLDRIFPKCSWFSGFEFRHWNYELQGEVEVLSGCFWVASKTAVDQVGGLDERFFFYAEDLDWCKRFRDAHWRVTYIPTASATHFGGGSSSNAPLRYSVEMLRANLSYWHKHHGNWGKGVYFLLALSYHGIRLAIRLPAAFFKRANIHLNNKYKQHQVCVRWLLTGQGA